MTGFVSDAQTPLIYGASLSWLAVLLFFESVALASRMWNDAVDVAVGASIVLNGVTLVAQTVDYVYFHFLFWPITAVNWCAQLASMGTVSNVFAFALVQTDNDTSARRWMAVVHLVAQALFTASQFSVTLEYIVRRLNQSATLPPMVTMRLRNSRR